MFVRFGSTALQTLGHLETLAPCLGKIRHLLVTRGAVVIGAPFTEGAMRSRDQDSSQGKGQKKKKWDRLQGCEY